MDQPKQGLSFGFSKVQEVRNLSKSVISETTEKTDTEKDFVLSVEGKALNSTKPKENHVKDYVIPLIKQNNWRVEKKQNVAINQEKEQGVTSDQEKEQGVTSDSLDLDALAAKEIIRESAKYNETWEDRGIENTTLSIPLLMQNKIPEGFESEEKIDVALRPDEPDEADYDKIPIEHYGMAMLRGMGWNQNQGIGKNAKVVAPIEAQLRPKGLGLGADKSNSTSTAKSGVSKSGKDTEEVLELKKNSCCLVTKGKHKDLYGTVEGLDEDNVYVIVKLALTGKVFYIHQSYVKAVGKNEFDKYSKYLNKGKADKYKECESHEITTGQSNKDQADKDERSSRHKRKKHNKKDRNEDQQHKHSKHSKEEKADRKKDSEKHNSKHSYSDSSGEEDCNNSSTQKPWLRNDLKVRIIDKTLSKGKYYNSKVVIMDVPSAGICICRTEDGRVLEDVHQSSLETIVPKEDNAYVAVVSGSHSGQIGQIMKRHKEKCLAVVQLLADRDNLLKLHYDEICQYVGNVHHHSDY